jgi:hypothetical protein
VKTDLSWRAIISGDIIGAISQVLNPYFQKSLNIAPRKRTVQPGDALEDTAFKQGFEINKL